MTAVRVERLHDITEAQAMAEGIEPVRWGDCENEVNWRDYMRDGDEYTDPRASFGSLGRSINGAGSVDANPWVSQQPQVPAPRIEVVAIANRLPRNRLAMKCSVPCTPRPKGHEGGHGDHVNMRPLIMLTTVRSRPLTN